MLVHAVSMRCVLHTTRTSREVYSLLSMPPGRRPLKRLFSLAEIAAEAPERS